MLVDRFWWGHVSDGIKPGIICIHEGAWPDIENGICKNGGANVLMADIPTSRLANGCAGIPALYMQKNSPVKRQNSPSLMSQQLSPCNDDTDKRGP
jgi:hypothetical protein